MAYPRELKLDKDTEDRLIKYIDDELTNHYAERGDHIDDLLRWQKDYWAKPLTEKAKFPFSGAATLIIPLTAIAVEAVHSKIMTTMFGQAQFVSAHALAPEWEGALRQVERFMDRELLDVMKIRRPLGDCFLECVKFGTMIGKSSYEKVVKTGIRVRGGVEEEFDVTVRDGAVFDAVPDSRFLMPYSAKDPQSAPWVGEEHQASWYEVEQMERSGLFREGTIINSNDGTLPGNEGEGIEASNMRFSRLRAYFATSSGGTMGDEGGRKFDNNQDQLQNVEPVMPKSIDWVELWLAYDIDGKGKTKEIVVHYHRGARCLMSARHNWHNDLSRPYDINVYFPLEHRWRGFGICKKNEQFQKEITTQHRQRLDNATLANMRMIRINKMTNYGPGEPIFPGKMWFVDNKDDIDTIQLGEIYPSAYNNEQATLIYSQQRTGINEVTLGMPQVGTPGTATSDLARIQEGKAKSDFVYQNCREFADAIINRTAANIQQFGPRQIQYYDLTEGGALVKQFFTMPAAYIRDGLLLRMKASGQQQNKIVDRQNWQQVAAMLQQYYGNLIQIAMPMQNPQLLMLIFQRALGASTEAMRQILESFDIRNIDRIIVKELDQVQPNGNGFGNRPQLGPGNSNGVTGIDPNATMDLFTAAIQSPRGIQSGESGGVSNSGTGIREAGLRQGTP